MSRILLALSWLLLLGAFAASPAAAATLQDCLRAADDDVALLACSEVVGSEPGNTAALLRRGKALFNKGAHDRAIADFDKVLVVGNAPILWRAEAHEGRAAARRAKADVEGAKADTAAAAELRTAMAARAQAEKMKRDLALSAAQKKKADPDKAKHEGIEDFQEVLTRALVDKARPKAATPSTPERAAFERAVLSALLGAIDRAKPARSAGEARPVRVRFTLSPEGTVSSVSIAASSGSSTVDQAVLAAVVGAEFPRPSAGLSEVERTFESPIQFR